MTSAIAEDALAAIAVEYEPLPFVHDLATATAEGAPPALLARREQPGRPGRRCP